MEKSPAIQKLEARAEQISSVLCVGLDSSVEKLPDRFKQSQQPQFEFNRWIIGETSQYAAAYKLNTAFYEARGAQGWLEMASTVAYLKENYPDIFLIADAKRADIGSTNQGYVQAFFDDLQFDAVTLHPYLGKEALQPFLAREDKACIILCKTSNPGSGELQDLTIQDEPLWQRVARQVTNDWNGNNNCMLVVGATYPEELKAVRQSIGNDMWLLVPGVGAQGGDTAEVMSAGAVNGKGVLINSSRGIIFADDPAEAASLVVESLK